MDHPTAGRPARIAVATALAIVVLVSTLTALEDGQKARYGIFSNMEASGGHYSGFEIFVLPSNQADFVVVQMAEGWPGAPVLLPVTPTADPDSLVFEHPELGPFAGTISSDSLTGEFTQARYGVRLARGASIWQ